MLCKLSYLSIFLFFLTSAHALKPTVKITHGVVSGKVSRTLLRNDEYYSFTGIPYAAPPVKSLRFLPPQPVDPWDEVLDTTKGTKPCFQFNNDVKKGQPFGHYGAEDCLHLDVFTPALDQNKRGIIIFLHNAQFGYSYNKTDYRPDFFIEEDVVVVTINHRLSLFGFLSLEDEILPGNAGLKDIVAGLEFVKNNAVYFGGDPERITLMGSQGGAAAVDLLVHSRARELFNSAILQSGTSWSPLYLQENTRERAFALAERLRSSASSSKKLLAELNEISPEILLRQENTASPEDYSRENQRGSLAFAPVVENHPSGLVTDYPELAGKINMPLMIGFNSREGLEASLEFLIEPRYLKFFEKDFPLLMPTRVNYKFDPQSDSYLDAVEDVKKFYFPGGRVKISSVPEYVTYVGDVLTAYGVNAMAGRYSNISAHSVFYYQFDYYSELSENKNNILKLSTEPAGTAGAAAADDLCYLFVCPALKDTYKKHHQKKTEESLISRKLVRLWSNFVKFGNPTPDNDTVLEHLKWPRYTSETKEYLHIDKQLEVRRNSINNRFRFWDRFLAKWGRKAVNGVVSDAPNKDEL